MMVLGGLLAMLLRIQLAWPHADIPWPWVSTGGPGSAGERMPP